MEQEYWKDIKGFEGYYQISSHGRVKSVERESWNSKCMAVRSEKILKINKKEANIHGAYHLTNDLQKKYLNIKDLLLENFDFEISESFKSYDKSFFDLFHKKGVFNDYIIENLYLSLKDTAIRVFDYEGNMINDYPSSVHFYTTINIETDSKSSAYTVAKGQYLSDSFGFQFRYLKNTDNQLLSLKKLPSLVDKMRSDTKPVAKYFGGKLICVYNSITEAAENNLLPVEKVWQSLDKEVKIHGFTFKRIE